MLEFIPFDPAEDPYERMAATLTALFSDMPATADYLRWEDTARNPERYRERYWVVSEGQEIGHLAAGESSFSHREGKYWIQVYLSPEAENDANPAFRFLLDRFEQRGGVHFVSMTRSDKPERMGLLGDLGFKLTLRMPISWVELSAFDPSAWAETEAMVRASGIRIVPASDLRLDDATLHAMHELFNTLMAEVPYTDAYTPQIFPEWMTNFDSPEYDPDLYLTAFDGEAMVGTTQIWRQGGRIEVLQTGLTGVSAPLRRRGIASALKAAALRIARNRGAQRVYTDNEENNPMLELNKRFGFEEKHAWMHFERKLN